MSARLGLYYGALFLVIGLLLPFWPVWLADRGATPVEIGVLLGLGPWMRLVANPVAAQVADRWRGPKPVLVILSLASVLAYLLFAGARDFPSLMLVSVLAGATISPLMPLSDNLAMVTAYARKLDYGRIRLWGSLTFIAASFGGGAILEARDPAWILWLVIGGLAAVSLSALLLPRGRATNDHAGAGSPRSIWDLLRHPVYAVFLFAAGLNTASHAVLYGFATLHWRGAGVSDVAIGLLWAEGVIAEILLFVISNRVVGRLGPINLLLLAGAGGVVRWLATGLTSDLAVLVVVQALHAATFGAAHLAAMHFLTRAAPAPLSATAQSLYAALGTGLAMGLGMIAAGHLYDGLGAGAFHVMAGLSLASLAGALWLRRRWSGGVLALSSDESRRPPAR